MIAYLAGVLAAKSPEVAVVDVGGVAFAVQIPLSTYARLGPIDSATKLHTYLAVRENALELFGFLTIAERDLFERLLGVTGIGPRLALSVLSGMEPRQFRLAILSEDARALARIHGVGRKTAERLIVELRESFREMELPAEGASAGEAPPSDAQTQAMMALASLGLRQPEIARAVREAAQRAGEGATTEQIVKETLRRL